MKIRMGFVSNSSSGSFIMHWRVRTFGKKITLNKAIGNLMGVYFKRENEQETEEIDWENTWNHGEKDKIDKMIENTVVNDDGTFTSAFGTSMVNNSEDFGEAAKSLVMGIVANEDYEIIDARTQMDY